jgi:hypothetical protein
MSFRNPQNERYTAEKDAPRSPGATRPSAGSAKPVSKAAASVRVESKPKKATSARARAMQESTMSKEERKAAKAKEREEENLVYTATTILTNGDAKYKKLKRVWWAMLIAAVVCTALSWVTLSTGFGGQWLSVVILVLAYVGIIGALIMDFTVVRKRRNVFRDRVNAMTKKQVERIVEDSYAQRAADDAAKKARKEAKKAGKSEAEVEAAAEAARAEALKPAKEKAADEKAATEAAAQVKKAETAVPAEADPAAAAEAERLARAEKVARDFANSKR